MNQRQMRLWHSSGNRTLPGETMHEAISRQSQIGLYLLEDAILELLYLTRLGSNKAWLNSTDIHHALGLQANSDLHCEVVQAVLNSLYESGRVNRKGFLKKNYWRITDVEYRKRQIGGED